MKKYFKRPEFQITAVQLAMSVNNFEYQKWGDKQTAKSNDWLVNANGNVYTIDNAVFARTYREVSCGRYEKIAAVYAEQAQQDGSIATLEGRTHYSAGDYLVYEQPGRAMGAYAIKQAQFEKMYQAED
ncbi:MAG: hypothetical protein ACI9FR_002020 [Cryomorphaceae bacterium]|jgi:hypothetical protein